MKRVFSMAAVGLGLSLISSCGESGNPYEPRNVSVRGADDIPITYSVSKLSDSLNAYCFAPVAFQVQIPRADLIYIDSVFLRPSYSGAFMKLDSAYSAEYDYADTGIQTATARIYFRADGGEYKDTALTLRTAINYSGAAVNKVISARGSDIELSASGSKYDGVKWHWDLSRVGGGSLSSLGDTTVFIDGSYEDTVYLSQTDSSGRRSPRVPVLFHTEYYAVPPVSVSVETNNRCFYPVSVKVNVAAKDIEQIDSILVYSSADALVPAHLNAANNYTAVFTYADTGSQQIRVRVFEASGNAQDTAVYVVMGVNYGVAPVNAVIADTGSFVQLSATGPKNDGIQWRWDLSRVGGGVIASDSNDTSVFFNRALDDTIFVSQIDPEGRRSPSAAVPFKTRFHQAGRISLTVESMPNLCFFPVTAQAMFSDVTDEQHIDSILVYQSAARVGYPLYRLNAKNGYKAAFNYADTGAHEISMRVYPTHGERRDTTAVIRIGLDVSAAPLSFGVDAPGGGSGAAALRVSDRGQIAAGARWRWNLADFGLPSLNVLGDTVIQSPIRRDSSGVAYLSQVMTDTLDGAARARETPRTAIPFSVYLKKYNMKLRNHGDGIITNFQGDSSVTLPITSGASGTVTFGLGDDVVIDSVFIGGVKQTRPADGFSAISYNNVYGDLEVDLYSRIVLKVEILHPIIEENLINMAYVRACGRGMFEHIAVRTNKTVKLTAVVRGGTGCLATDTECVTIDGVNVGSAWQNVVDLELKKGVNLVKLGDIPLEIDNGSPTANNRLNYVRSTDLMVRDEAAGQTYSNHIKWIYHSAGQGSSNACAAYRNIWLEFLEEYGLTEEPYVE